MRPEVNILLSFTSFLRLYCSIAASATCQIPEAPRNGGVLGLLYKKEEKAVYSCFNGYKLNKDDMVQTCRADGSWTGTIPECVIGNVFV